ncbi:hypothetical protein [Clostridium vincentii]|uniref:DUF3784 domain-containing protein n=1 Tax=Clostridium vincentii TaxID=52704 RepID=A0A2T0BBB3_9CLOT|nr:hypothetical protein [Clostridium vincentii]PRR81196.1 hypothetical protein CLVI_27000 [Clostridium vincentii]
MVEIIFQIIVFSLGVWGMIFTIKNRRTMPGGLYGILQNKYEIINKDKLNSILCMRSYALSIYFIFISIIAILTKNFLPIVFLGLTPIIFVAFNIKAKKYVKFFD